MNGYDYKNTSTVLFAGEGDVRSYSGISFEFKSDGADYEAYESLNHILVNLVLCGQCLGATDDERSLIHLTNDYFDNFNKKI